MAGSFDGEFAADMGDFFGELFGQFPGLVGGTGGGEWVWVVFDPLEDALTLLVLLLVFFCAARAV